MLRDHGMAAVNECDLVLLALGIFLTVTYGPLSIALVLAYAKNRAEYRNIGRRA
jgi:hypothetical protein